MFTKFKMSRDTLWIYNGQERVYQSDKAILAPLIEYISNKSTAREQVIILDKVMGNAAALLSVKAGAKKIYSPLGSELASITLSRYKIEYYLEKVVPFILARNGEDICPMEKLSRGKNPEEFYQIIKMRLNQDGSPFR